MDLVSSIRKSGSRGGVNFNWEDVQGSVHRENYLGHSLKAPVGRWQKGRDLNWYAKPNATAASSNETAEERAERERKEELKQIKEAEEDALARALGLPVAQRNVTGSNSIEVGEGRGAVGDNPAAAVAAAAVLVESQETEGSKRRASKRHDDPERRHRRRHRSRSRNRDSHRDRERTDREITPGMTDVITAGGEVTVANETPTDPREAKIIGESEVEVAALRGLSEEETVRATITGKGPGTGDVAEALSITDGEARPETRYKTEVTYM
ncbi:Uu.00g094240.m01.CDS01 [Anthostomella pinea]|uniref:Uu.00g094240.m01.CDS01 n=1 Tax=Anthostomella pinea TaxID=933095 RepID=A0AAI8YKS3_9PEZI|nr:Uu.00g094240.m01.CDS01 [Anthostomella pinea]